MRVDVLPIHLVGGQVVQHRDDKRRRSLMPVDIHLPGERKEIPLLSKVLYGRLTYDEARTDTTRLYGEVGAETVQLKT